MNEQPVYTVDEFASEAHYLETLIWEAIVVLPEAKVLMCGYGPDGSQVQRAIDCGAKVTVIEHRSEPINAFSKLDARLLRGSTSVIPAKDNSFDLAIAHHYLHEIDPFFHSQVLSELARVARRVAVIEPAPPADPLGKRIALLYSQAKRELGQFEYYQPLEYWKKLLHGVKADVSQHVFAFSKVPPRHYLIDTIQLLLDTIEVEDAPREYMDELRQIARRSDAQLLPPPRYVLVGAAAGDLLVPSFTPRLPSRPPLPAPAPAAAPASAQPAPRRRRGRPAEVSAQSGYELPPVEAAPRLVTPPDTIEPEPAVAQAPPPPPPAPPKPKPAPAPFGAPAPPAPGAPGPGAPFGMPFATPPGAPPEPPGFGFSSGTPPAQGWEWEPPEGDEPPPLP
ncbi:MAG TPA: class I SAM-dependent methyltransferase [Candidatus Baltobacteraceae bacterium]|nr:class I SAM-dependent methyltransferase [Candidatus Baltobacteraceae bacterium]